MAHRVEIVSKIPDARADVFRRKLQGMDFKEIDDVCLVDVYTTNLSLDDSQLKSVASMLANPVTQKSTIDKAYVPEQFDWAIEIGYLPGVTDNTGVTARESVEDLLSQKLPNGEGVYTSQVAFLSGNLSRDKVNQIADSLANPIIQRVHIKEYDEFRKDGGMDTIVPQVKLDAQPVASIIEILDACDDELVAIGKKGVANQDGMRRGPLALDLTYMKDIQTYFRKLGRNPTDIELESVAQTWSEHCKHTIFADPLDEVTNGLYKTFIQAATNSTKSEICRRAKR